MLTFVGDCVKFYIRNIVRQRSSIQKRVGDCVKIYKKHHDQGGLEKNRVGDCIKLELLHN